MANSRSGDTMAERIVAVLSSFSAQRPAQSAAEIGRRAGLPASTAHRIVDDLVGVGLLERDSRNRVVLGMRLWELAHRGSRAMRLREAALPYMQQVQARMREHTQLAVLEDEDVLFLERLSDPKAGLNVAQVAGRLPLHSSSSGLVLFAHAGEDVIDRVLARALPAITAETVTDAERLRTMLASVRERGFMIAPGMMSQESTGVAVPVRSRGRVVAALSVVLPRDSGREHAAVTVLSGAAVGISASLSAPED